METKEVTHQVLENNPKAVKAVKDNPKAINKLIGLVMKEKPNANPKEVLTYLNEYFGLETKKKKKKVKTEIITNRYWKHKETGQKVVTSFRFITDGRQFIDKDTGKNVVEINEGWQYYRDWKSKEYSTGKMLIDDFERLFEYEEKTIEIETL